MKIVVGDVARIERLLREQDLLIQVGLNDDLKRIVDVTRHKLVGEFLHQGSLPGGAMAQFSGGRTAPVRSVMSP